MGVLWGEGRDLSRRGNGCSPWSPADTASQAIVTPWGSDLVTENLFATLDSSLIPEPALPPLG